MSLPRCPHSFSFWPENHFSWDFRKKWMATVIVSFFTFISPVSSSMVAPATSQIAEEFGMTTNTVIQAMVTSVFVLGYGMSELPIFWNKKVQNSLISCPQAFGPLVRKSFASTFAFPSLLSFFLGSWSDEWIVGTIEGFAVGQSLLPRSVLSLLLSFHIYNSIALSLSSRQYGTLDVASHKIKGS